MRTIIGLLCLWALTSACSPAKSGGTTTGNPATEDTSSSGAALAAVGGALSGSSSGGLVAQSKVATQIPLSLSSSVQAQAGQCPTYLTTTGSGCAVSGSTMWLSYVACQFPNSPLTFTGTQSLIMSSGTAACGTFPNPGANGTLYRQYVSASGGTSATGGTTAASLIERNSFGTSAIVDNRTTNLSNFDLITIPTLVNGGYGAKIDFDGTGARSAITIAHRVYTAGFGGFDHTIRGSLTISETAGASTRSVSGSLTVYYNNAQVIGTTTFTSLVHKDICCLPVSGTVTTAFSAGANTAPTTAGALIVGKSETLTITGCGTGTLLRYDGSTENVALTRCY